MTLPQTGACSKDKESSLHPASHSSPCLHSCQHLQQLPAWQECLLQLLVYVLLPRLCCKLRLVVSPEGTACCIPWKCRLLRHVDLGPSLQWHCSLPSRVHVPAHACPRAFGCLDPFQAHPPQLHSKIRASERPLAKPSVVHARLNEQLSPQLHTSAPGCESKKMKPRLCGIHVQGLATKWSTRRSQQLVHCRLAAHLPVRYWAALGPL
mmetsp:Transcript_64476/g.127466  ORF Transcript_64476/g.127466 Transcript_64476/m.127466 type:complete len:208 (-) Transcript_64476:2019-2642(-)